MVIGTVVILIVRKSKTENLDQLFSRGDIERRA